MNGLIQSLENYRRNQKDRPAPDHVPQAELVDRFIQLAGAGAPCLNRDYWDGHLTGSALVVSLELDRVLLTLHAKLGMWLQLGGHADGDSDLSRVAMREAAEESGIAKLDFFPLLDIYEDDTSSVPIFDLDIHKIPERAKEPAHYHYDIRYLILADARTPFVVSAESKELRWIPLSDAYGMSKEWSMHRQFDKLAWIRKNWARA